MTAHGQIGSARSRPPPGIAASGQTEPERVLLRLERRDGEVRVTASKFRGVDRVGVRFWFRGQDGGVHPTQKGVALRPDEAAQVASAIDEAVRVLEGGAPGADPTARW